MPKYALYNGVKLPALPDYDATEYPYLYMMITTYLDGTGLAYLYACSKQGFIHTYDEYGNLYYTRGSTDVNDYTEDQEFYSCQWMASIGEDITSGLYEGVNTREWSVQYEHEWCVVERAGNSTTGNTIDWSNHLICWEDGTPFILGTDPVPVYFDQKAWLAGFTIGLASKGYPWAKPAATAYLYNGIRLPALPEWDRVKYPYAAIGKWLDVYQLYLSTVPLTYRNTINSWYFDATEDGEALVYQTTTDAMIWEEQEAMTFTAGHAVYVMLGGPHWASYDINHSTSGNIVLAASEPIPVYE